MPLRALPFAAVALLGAAPATAEVAKPFEVTARVVAGCAVATDAGGRWGTIDLGRVAGAPGAAAEGALLSVAGAGLGIECTPGVSASLTADAGDHPLSGERRLGRTGGNETIGYRLYVDGAAAGWTGAAVALAFSGGRRVVPIRAVATLAAPVPAGTYADAVRVTLTW